MNKYFVSCTQSKQIVCCTLVYFAAVLTLEKLLKAFDCLFALKLCFGLHTPQLILFALQCFSKKKNKKHKFWVLCKPYQEYNT